MSADHVSPRAVLPLVCDLVKAMDFQQPEEKNSVRRKNRALM